MEGYLQKTKFLFNSGTNGLRVVLLLGIGGQVNAKRRAKRVIAPELHNHPPSYKCWVGGEPLATLCLV